MKSKLPIVAALVTIILGLPVKAEDTRIKNRIFVVGMLARVDCAVRYQGYDPELAKERIQEYVNENPHLKAAYIWGTTSDKAMEAVQALRPYHGFDCSGFILSEEKVDQLMLPYLK